MIADEIPFVGEGNLAIKRHIWVLLEDGNPADCAEAQSLINAATARHLAEHNTAELAGGLIDPENRLTLEEWSIGDRLWLVDLIAPFADESNRRLEVMMADLISGPLRGQEFRFHRVDPKTGARESKIVPAAAGEDLRQALEKAAIELAR